MASRTKHAGLTGYRLHLRRFAYTGKQGMRSVKFPVTTDDAVRDTALISDVVHDQLHQVGPLTVSTWLAERHSGETIYALTDLWLDALRAGFLFAPSGAALLDTLAALGLRESPDARAARAFAERAPALAAALDFAKLKRVFLLKGEVRSTATPASVAQKFAACARAGIDSETEAQLQREGDALARALLGKPREAQDAYWRERFGIDKAWWRGNGTAGEATAVPLTALPFAPEAEAGACLATYRAWGEAYPGIAATADELKVLLGLTDNYNAFSHFFGTVLPLLLTGRQGVEQLCRTYRALVPSWDESALHERIAWLATRVARLPAHPSLTRSWADYRSTFGGKLASWYSNRVNQEAHVRAVLAQQEADLSAIDALLAGDMHDDVAPVRAVVARAAEARAALATRVPTEQELLVYRDLLADVRRRFVPLMQRMHEEAEDIGVLLKKRFPGIFGERVRFLPGFVGDQKRLFFARYLHAHARVEQGVALLVATEQELRRGHAAGEVTREDVLRALDTLLRLYRRGVTPRYAQVLHGLFSQFELDVRTLAADERARVWCSPFSRARFRSVPVRDGVPRDDVARICAQTKPRWSDLGSVEDRLIAVEIEKVRMSLLVRAAPTANVSFSVDSLSGFDAAQGFVSLMGTDTFAGEELGRLLQQYILAEMRGALSLMSRGEYVVRSVAQMIGSEKMWPLVCIPHEPDASVSRANRKEWAFVRKEHLLKEAQAGSLQVFVKEGKSDFAQGWQTRYVALGNVLHIRSGNAQLQFLDNALPDGDAAAWERFAPQLNSWSLIAEETFHVSWESGEPELEKEGARVFVSVPMSLGVSRKEGTKRLKERTRLLGVDVGEYGIAWTLVDTGTGVAGPSGFAAVPSLRTIRAGVRATKEKQAGGTFTVPSRYVDRLRDDAISSLRNQLHDVVLRYDARIVYEDSISNFETGSGRVTKVYNSVKRADVYADNDAAKMVQTLVWGKATGLVGATIGSRGTSRVCSACFECAYNYLHERDAETRCTVVSVDGADMGGSYVTIALPGDVRAHGFVSGAVSPGDSLGAREVIRALYAASRPPLDSARAREALARSCPDHTADVLQRFIERRGNSALFVCPFCEHVSDADMQASLVVALKRKWKDARATEAHFDERADANERVLQFARFTAFARAWYRDQCGNEAVPLDLGL